MIEAVERCPWCGSKITHSRFVQIQDAIRKDEQRKLAALEKAFDAERAKVSKQVELSKQEADKLRRKEIAEIRQILQRDRDAALVKKEAEFTRERDALQKKIVQMSRRVGKGGADIADGAEIDLHDELRGAFPEACDAHQSSTSCRSDCKDSVGRSGDRWMRRDRPEASRYSAGECDAGARIRPEGIRRRHLRYPRRGG